jgi:hypothetical protein
MPKFEDPELKRARQARYRQRNRKLLADKDKTYRTDLPDDKKAHAKELQAQRAKKRTAQAKQDRLTAPQKPALFIAIDGEAHREADGRSVYSYLRAAGLPPLVDRKGLDTTSILEYLFTISPYATIVGFVLNYDWENWLRDLPDDCYKYLTGDADIMPAEGADWDRTIRTYKDETKKLIANSIEWHGYTISYYPRKIFSVAKMGWNGKLRRRKILDVWGYCQGSFLKACKDWEVATKEELEVIEAGKKKRDVFTWEELSYTAYYNELELDLMVKLAHKIFAGLDEACKLAGLPIRPAPGDLYGPGAIARKIMREVGWPENLGRTMIPEDKKDVYLETVAQADDQQKNYLLHCPIIASYYGGRIEAAATGRWKKVFDYDLRSAYPAAITRLPYLPGEQMAWRDYENPQSAFYAAALRREVGMYYVMWHFPAGWQWYPFPTRQKKNRNVFYPRSGQGWICSPELFAAMESLDYPEAAASIKIYHAWTIPSSAGLGAGHKPLPEELKSPMALIIERMYAIRAAIKKLKKQGAQLSLKLILNSEYGKLLQQVGVTLEKLGFFHDLVASWITSWTRAEIYRGVAPHRKTKTVVAIQTDGIVTKKPLDLPLSSALGEWEQEELLDYRQLLPGLYDYHNPDHDTDPEEPERKERRRGMPGQFEFKKAWDLLQRPGEVYSFNYRTFLARRLYLAQPYKHAGNLYQWPEMEKTFRPDLGAKRGNPLAMLPPGAKFGDAYLAGKKEKWLLPKTNLQSGSGYPFKLKFDQPSYIPVEDWEIEQAALENSMDEAVGFFRE